MSVRQFIELPREELERKRLVMGHFGYGLHQRLPGPSRYVSMLREPVDRVVSLYYFFRSGEFPPGSPPAAEQATLRSSGMTIDGWMLHNRNPRWDNHMVRLIADARGVEFGHCSDDLLRQAKEHVENDFEALLLMEHMAPSMKMLAAIVGRDLPRKRDRNVNADRPVSLRWTQLRRPRSPSSIASTSNCMSGSKIDSRRPICT